MLAYMYIAIWVTAVVGLELFDYIREGIADAVEKNHKLNQPAEYSVKENHERR